MEKVLTVQHLTKRIRGRAIVEDVSFELYPGEIFGFLGPNGAGKTTTIRMLVDLIKPTSGEVRICGHSVRRSPEKALSHVGCIVENPEVYGFLTGWENLEHYARMLRGVDSRRIAEVVRIAQLDERIHDKVKTYSLGMRQRLGIAQALLGRPRLLILDEPTNGLDPQGIKELREFVRSLAAEGISLFISSHMLNEIQLMCDRYAIIYGGRIKAVGRMDQLVNRSSGLVLWRLENEMAGKSLLASDPAVRLPETAAGGEPSPSAGMPPAIPDVMDYGEIPAVVGRLVERGIGVLSVHPAAATLENLFLEMTTREERRERI